MFDYIQGKIVELTPANVVLESGNVGYYIHISLYTFTSLKERAEARLYIQQVIREDAHLLYGFADKKEREMFRMLVTVSGIGVNTARLILSSLTPAEVIQAIVTENVPVLQGIKGIGGKTAQRVIVDLKDKVGKISGEEEFLSLPGNSNVEESLSALVTLGFPKALVKKTIEKIIAGDPGLAVEEIIKEALKIL
ncbi:MAG: Holliday junction branch migration protein RuvA [Bacteroidales bacterium]|nr:Holliday junction branch migration protein RuvA [Bacteroidales bacterium]